MSSTWQSSLGSLGSHRSQTLNPRSSQEPACGVGCIADEQLPAGQHLWSARPNSCAAHMEDANSAAAHRYLQPRSVCGMP